MQNNDLREVVPGVIWVGERTLWFSGVRLRSRMTVLRLAGGRLWVHSPSEPNSELCASLDCLGEVSWVVVPNRFHHLHAPAFKDRYPEATLLGPESVLTKNRLLRLDALVDDERVSRSLPSFRRFDFLVSLSSMRHSSSIERRGPWLGVI